MRNIFYVSQALTDYAWSKILRTCTIEARQAYHILHLFHLSSMDHCREVSQNVGQVMTLGFLMGIMVLNLQSSNAQLVNELTYTHHIIMAILNLITHKPHKLNKIRDTHITDNGSGFLSWYKWQVLVVQLISCGFSFIPAKFVQFLY